MYACVAVLTLKNFSNEYPKFILPEKHELHSRKVSSFLVTLAIYWVKNLHFVESFRPRSIFSHRKEAKMNLKPFRCIFLTWKLRNTGSTSGYKKYPISGLSANSVNADSKDMRITGLEVYLAYVISHSNERYVCMYVCKINLICQSIIMIRLRPLMILLFLIESSKCNF